MQDWLSVNEAKLSSSAMQEQVSTFIFISVQDVLSRRESLSFAFVRVVPVRYARNRSQPSADTGVLKIPFTAFSA